MNLKNILATAFFTLHFSFCFSNKIDSLLNALNTAKHDTNRVQIFSDLCWEYKNCDTVKALQYALKGVALAKKYNFKKGIALCYSNIGVMCYEKTNNKQAIEYFSKAIKISEEINDKKGLVSYYLNLGSIYSDLCDYSKAKNFYSKSLALAEELRVSPDIATATSGKNAMAHCYNNLGIVYDNLGAYDKAIEFYLKSLKIREELSDSPDKATATAGKNGIANCCNNIGGVYFNHDNYGKAIEYFSKALKLFKELNEKKGIAMCLNNIGLIYRMQENYNKAIEYFYNSLKIHEEKNDFRGQSLCYNNLGITYMALNKNNVAIEYYHKCLKMLEKIEDKFGIALVLVNMSELNMKLGNYKNAIHNAQQSLLIAKETGELDNQKFAYCHLANAYDSLRNYKEAYKYHKLYKLITDSIFNEEGSKQIKNMEAKYQSEKKQKEIELKESQLAKKNIEVKQQRTQKFAFIGGFVLMLVLSVVIFKSYRDKKKANILLAEQKHEIEEKNEELNQQNAEIAAQRDEIEAQRDLVTKQKEEIELIHSELKDSIYYAERIQKAVLPDLKDILSLKSQDSSSKTQDPLEFGARNLEFEAFILFRPKDIVSGDFYWMAKRNNWLLIAVADCTGHGVPGAFMSMLGISFLNEIIAKEEIQTASHVLDELRKYVIHSLQQKGILGEQKDGMDMAFVAIDLNPQTSQVSLGSEPGKTSEVYTAQFAGANNPLYIVSSLMFDVSSSENNLKLQTSNLKLHEVKPDKMPVAIHENMQPFTNHIIQLQKGDTIYLMSDGYADQFGGPKGRKFYEKQLKEILFVNSHLSMVEQKEIIDKTIEDWKNKHDTKYEQTDDITIVGVKI
ncbi:MAG: tetratricopeptide repeat protein [Bacteroidia bacterium]|nr:tetratricopeptide repeat protein [Bacteroidia bacterium]